MNQEALLIKKIALAAYGGSASCRECHAEAFGAWTKSHHALAERNVAESLDRNAFEPGRPVMHGAQMSQTSWHSGQPQFTAPGLAKSNELFAVARVIGHDPIRQFLVNTFGGRLQALEASYDPRSNEWFNVFGNEDRQPGEWGHWTGRGMNWNNMCAGCHNTNLRKNYAAATDSYHTTMAETSVGCEACHGPLQAHNNWQKQFGKSGKKDPTLAKLTPRQTVDNCGSCHARRSDLTGEFAPGEFFSDHYRLVSVDAADTFFPDGQIRDEDYEFAPFLASKMHARGVVCGDCHDPHSAKTRLPGNWLCMRCHSGGYTNAPIIDPVAHSHHTVYGYDTKGVLTNTDLQNYKPSQIKETGGECVNCHMPQTVFMQRHWRHDHGFTIPDPLLTKQFNIPNACNRCHANKSTDWALEAVDKWYDAKMQRPTRQRAQAIARARAGEAAADAGLIPILQRDEIPYWRSVAARMLAPWAGETNVIAALVRGLNDTNALVREACAQSLEPLAAAVEPGMVATLEPLLHDSARSVRVAAAWALRAGLDTNSPAGKDLQRMLDFNADQPVGQMQLGAFYFARNDLPQALEHFQTAVAWDPNSPPLRQELAVVLSALNRPREAVEQLEAACRAAPRDAESHYRLALACNEAGDAQRTIAELETTVTLEPRHGRAWYNLGLAQNGRGESTNAIESLIRAESIEPGDAQIPYARATILARLGRIEEAKAAARRAVELRPDFREAMQLLQSFSRQ